MNTHIQSSDTPAAPAEGAAKEPYHAPRLQKHGRLERLTLQNATSTTGGTGNTPVDPGGLNG